MFTPHPSEQLGQTTGHIDAQQQHSQQQVHTGHTTNINKNSAAPTTTAVGNYQQWLPTQFAGQLSMHPYQQNGAAFYPPPPQQQQQQQLEQFSAPATKVVGAPSQANTALLSSNPAGYTLVTAAPTMHQPHQQPQPPQMHSNSENYQAQQPRMNFNQRGGAAAAARGGGRRGSGHFRGRSFHNGAINNGYYHPQAQHQQLFTQHPASHLNTGYLNDVSIPDGGNGGYYQPYLQRGRGFGRGGRYTHYREARGGGRSYLPDNNTHYNYRTGTGAGPAKGMKAHTPVNFPHGTSAAAMAAACEDLVWKIKQLPRDSIKKKEEKEEESSSLDEILSSGLQYLDSRAVASLLKELGRSGLAYRAQQIFEYLKSLDSSHAYTSLLDEFTYTSLISNCVPQKNLDLALQLAQEMDDKGIQRNVHTFTALMNVAIKCGQYKMALDVYKDMRQQGCPANVVTYNTLIDLYGKSGLWEDALDVLPQMRLERVPPVTRTFNTLMIACNTSGQWQESLRVYDEMRAERHQPNTTTFNALISAHSKAGDLAKVLSVFKEMVQQGCERSVITYSALISACEKAGEWKLAMQLFDEMRQEGCVPNVVAYNSLITACAQGAQWEKAEEVFKQMQLQGCTPDVVSYTALIQAYERGGKWKKALEAFEDMRATGGCSPDAIIFSAIMDVLWDTGIACAQRKAVELFKEADKEGLVRRFSHSAGQDSIELNLHSAPIGVALLALYRWLTELKERVDQQGAEALPARITIIAGKGKSREAPHSIIKESVASLLLKTLKAPLTESPDSTPLIGRFEGNGPQFGEWLLRHGQVVLDSIIPPEPLSDSNQEEESMNNTNSRSHIVSLTVSERSVSGSSNSTRNTPKNTSGGEPTIVKSTLKMEDSTEDLRIQDAFSTVQFFEKTHCLNLPVMPAAYLQHRTELFLSCAVAIAQKLGLPEETLYDALLLMDRAMSIPLELSSIRSSESFGDESIHKVESSSDGGSLAYTGAMALVMASCVQIAAQQSGLPEALVPSLTDVAGVAGVSYDLLIQAQSNLTTTLSSDTASISALRCLKLYLERIGAGVGYYASTAWSPLSHIQQEEGHNGTSGTSSNTNVTPRTSIDESVSTSSSFMIEETFMLKKGRRDPFHLLYQAVMDTDLLNFRPSVVAAAVLYTERKSRGLAPYWPSALSTLTGYDMHAVVPAAPEMNAAVAAVQRVFEEMQLPTIVREY